MIQGAEESRSQEVETAATMARSSPKLAESLA
jgi:hypothetical protein